MKEKSIWDELKHVTRVRHREGGFSVLVPQGSLEIHSYGRGMFDVNFIEKAHHGGSLISFSSVDDAGATFWCKKAHSSEFMLALFRAEHWFSGLPDFDNLYSVLRMVGYYGEVW